MFHMTPDEPAQLAMARLISGGLRWNMFDHSTWRPGMAVLLAPPPVERPERAGAHLPGGFAPGDASRLRQHLAQQDPRSVVEPHRDHFMSLRQVRQRLCPAGLAASFVPTLCRLAHV
jgi:hypothetical protein